MPNPKSNIALQGKSLQLGYLHKGAKKEILSNLNFELYSGELTCLLGPNGVGKSTLIKAILGQIHPWKGELLLQGSPISTYSLEELALRLAVVLTEPVFPGNMTVEQLVALGRTPHTGWSGRLQEKDREAVENAISRTKIGYLTKERLSEISDGQRQKTMIARAIAQDGEVILLDEPTAHLDLVNRFEIMQLLREIAIEEQKAILVVTHDLEIGVETADKFWLMTCGNPLVSGSPEDLILSGKINQLLPSKKYFYSAKRGRLEMEEDALELSIQGSEEWVYWVKKAFRKAKITQVPSMILVKENPFSLEMDSRTFASLEEIIQFLQNYSKDPNF